MPLQVIIREPGKLPSQPSTPSESESHQTTKLKKLFYALGITAATFVVIVATGLGIWILTLPDLISPLSQTKKILGFGDIAEKPNKVVYGFLPYWNYKLIDQIDFSQLTHLALFGVAYNLDGSIQTREADYMEPGYRNITSDVSKDLIKEAHEEEILVTLTLTAFKNDVIESIISNPSVGQKAIEDTVALVEKYDFDGVNLDFEYVGSPDQITRDQFSQFAQKLTKALKESNEKNHISVSVYADSANNDRIWDLNALGQTVDHVIIMAYDFHRSSSPTAGPVAPLFGAGEGWNQDIITLLGEHMTVNHSSKLLLGVPFYGYEWRTGDDQYLSETYKGSGRLASYSRVKELLNEHSHPVQWNNASLSPWISYSPEEGYINQIYFEDIRSLGFKYDLVNQTNLGGIAIWALGYEGDNPEVWDLVREKF